MTSITLVEYTVLYGLVLFSGVLTYIGTRECVSYSLAHVAYYRKLTQSSIERKVFDGLVGFGYLPITQYKIGRYSLDLAFPQLKLDIECDGEIWHNTPQAIEKDRKRDIYMRERGWSVLRFTDKEINENPQRVVNLIVWQIKKTSCEVKACGEMVGQRNRLTP